MPRPDFSKARSGRGTTSRNPFAAWLAHRKEAKMAAAEQAAKIITNDTAKNEAAIVDKLASIDFLHSKLPKEVLDAKSDPNRPYGDLEYASRAIQSILLKNPQSLSADIRSIDEKLLTLSILFKQAIEQGDEKAAFAAKAGLLRGLTNIRNKIPENQPDLFKLFVETNTKYLDSWVTLVNLSQVSDRMKQNVEREREMYASEKEKCDNDTDALYELLKNDYEMNQAYQEIIENDSVENRIRWNDKQREVHIMMVERRMAKARLNLKNFMLVKGEEELSTKNNEIEVLYAKVAKMPIVTDPNLMNKYKEQVDLLFKELAETDVEIDESLQLLDEIDGRIEQLDNAPGAVRAREVAAMEAEKALEDIRNLQLKKAGVLEAKAKAGLKELGLYSEDELKVLKKELEEQQAREAEKLIESIEVSEDEGEYIHN
jgi:hypothetical protein